MSLLFSCSKCPPKYKISGTLPSNNYDGMKIFLVPAVGDNPSNVDSVTIVNGHFTFVGDTERVSIIRMPMKVRYNFQDLLVVTEKGLIKVNIDSVSRGGGSFQNDLLQQWKNKVEESNKETAKYYIAKYNEVDSKQLKLLENKKDSVRLNMKKFTSRIICENGNTTLGKFLSRMQSSRN